MEKLGFLLSGGKDSLFAAYLMRKRGYDLKCAIIIQSENTASYMFHTPNTDIAKVQAECMNLPFVEGHTQGVKEEELKDLYNALKEARETYGVEGVVTGAIFSEYQSQRIQKVSDELGLKVYSPLWHMNQEEEMRALLKEGFTFVFSSVAAYGLDKSWVGRIIAEKDIDRLVELNKKYGINIAGEGGEFESLVLDCPLFFKAIELSDCQIKKEDENTAYFKVGQAKTYKKQHIR
ncbi:MAG: diphthine--ammonia ligase [Nanoarchaeota archaeon]